MNDFAKNLADILRIKNISQKKLGDLLGVKQNTVCQWVNGKREPTYDMLMEICILLDTDPSEMLGFQKIRNYTK